MTSRQAQALATQNNILNAARKLVLEIPYDQITMNAIAQEAQVSIGALYHHYPSKEALFYQVFHTFAPLVEKYFCIEDFATPIEIIRSILCALVDNLFTQGIHLLSPNMRSRILDEPNEQAEQRPVFISIVMESVHRGLCEGFFLPSLSANEISETLFRVTRSAISYCCVHHQPERASQILLHDLAMCFTFFTGCPHNSNDPVVLDWYQSNRSSHPDSK